MIIDQDGRHRSVRVIDEQRKMLEEKVSALSSEEQQFFWGLYEEAENGNLLRHHQTQQIDYETSPVDVETFLRDDYFLGESGKNLYPILMDDMIELFDGDYSEAILTGSLGWGKTYFASLATLYIVYQMSCLRHPQTVYGIDEGSYISLSMISINEKTARRAVFSELVAKLERSPYFQEKFPYKKYWIEVRFIRKPIMIVAGSTQSNAILSLNIFGGIMDEANFMGQVKTIKRRGSHVRFVGTDRAEVIYNAIIRRMKSRFMRGGKVPGILFLPSSKDVVSSFTEQRILESKDDPTIFVRDYNTWMIKRKHFMNSPMFKVLVGNERLNSRILNPGEEVEYEDIEGVKIIDVPEDYRKDFERNLEDAIREIAGESIFGVSLFFQRLDKIEDMCHAGDKAGLMHPYSVFEWQTDKPGEFAWDRICKRVTRRLPGGYTEEGWEPIRNPEAPRHVRLDPSLSGDCTGVAVGHVAGWSEVIRRDEKGLEYNELAPNIIVDFVLRVIPPVGDEILLGDIRSLIYQLMEHGFNVRFASSDQFQSADTKQKFRQRGIEAKITSTDKDRQMYQTLKVTIYEGRILCYLYPILVEELKRLEYDPVTGKVDHPKDGSKDVADALAGLVFHLTTEESIAPIPPTMGKQSIPDEKDDSWVTEGWKPVKTEHSSSTVQIDGVDVQMPPMPFVKK